MTTSITFPLLNEKSFSFDSIIHYKYANMMTHAKDTMLISKVLLSLLFPPCSIAFKQYVLLIYKSFK